MESNDSPDIPDRGETSHIPGLPSGALLEHAEEDCFGYAHVFRPWDVASSAQLHLKLHGLCAGQAGSLDDFFV